MQLGRPSLCAALAAASATLLGQAAPAVAASWQVDSSLLVYDEKDGVRSVAPSVILSREFADERKLTLSASYDSLSGASPTGASGAAQTVTSPSGKPVQITSGSGLIYAPFEDERQAVSLGWESRLDDRSRYTLGAAWSKEVDFAAGSVTAQVDRSFLKNNLTLAVGAAFEKDELDPVGGTPQAFSLNGGSAPKGGGKDRQQWDGLLSATLVLNPKTLAYLAWGVSQADGYLTDPYKVITVVDPDSGQPIDGQVFDEELGPNEKKANLYEKRPDTRLRQSLFGEIKRAFADDVLTLNYRFTHDDWEVDSHTVEASYHWQFGDTVYLQPNLRWYQQSAAYFYRHSLRNFEDISGPVVNVRYASADRRLSAFSAATAGLRLGWSPDRKQDLSLRVAAYQQQGDSHPDDAVGAQRSIDFFPRQLAWWVQLLYKRQW